MIVDERVERLIQIAVKNGIDYTHDEAQEILEMVDQVNEEFNRHVQWQKLLSDPHGEKMFDLPQDTSDKRMEAR